VIDTVLILALVAAFIAAAASAVLEWAAARRAKDEAARLAAAIGKTSELAASLDLDEVAQRAIDAVAALPGVDAVLLEAPNPAGGRTRAARGLSDEEAERVALQTTANSNLRAMDVTYRYRLDDADKAASFLRAGLVVPLVSEGRQIGALAAFTRVHATGFPEETVAALERLGLRAGSALDNAHRFAEARLLADIDSLTGLQNHRRFHELLAGEVARANRYQRNLALVVFDLDDFKRINDRVGHLSGDLALAEVARRVLTVVRSADIACRVGGDEFAVIMPESSLQEAKLLTERITRTVSGKPLGQGDTVHVSVGIADLKPEDNAHDLFERADEALYRAKQSGKGRIVAAG
jgi:diguanylate cyclase (GGDEF)-like protein